MFLLGLALGVFIGVNIGVLLMGVLASTREWETTEERQA